MNWPHDVLNVIADGLVPNRRQAISKHVDDSTVTKLRHIYNALFMDNLNMDMIMLST